jgi:hypothetical protein
MSDEPDNHRRFKQTQLSDLQTAIFQLNLDDVDFTERLDYVLGLAFSLRSQVAYTPLTPTNRTATTATTTCPKCNAALTVALS